MPPADSDPRRIVLEHLDAFNAHSTDRLLAGFAIDTVWATGQDVVTGLPALAELFDPGLWDLDPSLRLRTLTVESDSAAAQLCETITVAGAVRQMDIAVFFEIRSGRISRAKVYREGSADIA